MADLAPWETAQSMKTVGSLPYIISYTTELPAITDADNGGKSPLKLALVPLMITSNGSSSASNVAALILPMAEKLSAKAWAFSNVRFTMVML